MPPREIPRSPAKRAVVGSLTYRTTAMLAWYGTVRECTTYRLGAVAALDGAGVAIAVTGNSSCKGNSGESKSEDGREAHV